MDFYILRTILTILRTFGTNIMDFREFFIVGFLGFLRESFQGLFAKIVEGIF